MVSAYFVSSYAALVRLENIFLALELIKRYRYIHYRFESMNQPQNIQLFLQIPTISSLKELADIEELTEIIFPFN